MKPHSLLEFLTASRPSDPSAGSAFPGVLSPSTTSLGLAPCEAGYHSRPGSALRFSQPPSGFPADPSFAALFHAATVPGVLPSESSPHRNRAPLSRPPAPLWLSTRVQDAASWILLPPVSPTPTLSRSCLVPPATMDSLFTCPKTRFPVALDSSSKTALYGELHLLRSLIPLTNPFAIDSGCPSPTADTLLGFSLQSLLRPRLEASTRPGHEDLNTDLRRRLEA